MKNKDFKRFAKRNTHKRRSKDESRRELLRAVKEVDSSYADFKIRDSYDSGKRGDREARRHTERHAEGIFSSSRSGFGFVKTDASERDIFIPESKTRGALDGDRVEIAYHSFTGYNNEEKTEGRVLKICEYGRTHIIGTLDEQIYRHGRRTYRTPVIVPDDTRLNITPYVSETMSAEVGDKVIARLIRGERGHIECRVTEILGNTESLDANYLAILAECGIETEFSDAEYSEAERLSGLPLSKDGRTRFDDIIFTIDGEGAKDLDDAVSVRRSDNGFTLGVHIADVSEYVGERTPLDRCAMARGTSVYFIDRVVPMLPEPLSNGACSLNAGEEKYALSAIIELDKNGEILNTELKKSIIKSSVRGVYSEVNLLLSGEERPELIEKYKQVLPSLKIMEELYEILLKRRKAQGYIDFDSGEAVIILGGDGLPTDIIRRERGVSERMIEQFMLTANEAVATRLHDEGIPCVYRVHEEPPKDKFAEFLNFAHSLGFDSRVINRANVSPKALQGLLSLAKERGNFDQVSRAMLRSMAKAKYSSENRTHFGLGMEKYCHFTSPIRRLSDLATHRIIKRVLIEGRRPEAYRAYASRAAAAATDAELRAEEAERRIEDLYKALFMAEHLGEEFPAVVSSVTSFGLFCELNNTCEGLVPLSEMTGEFFFDEKTLTLRSRDTSYHIADSLTVLLEEVDIIRGKLRFSIVEK